MKSFFIYRRTRLRFSSLAIILALLLPGWFLLALEVVDVLRDHSGEMVLHLLHPIEASFNYHLFYLFAPVATTAFAFIFYQRERLYIQIMEQNEILENVFGSPSLRVAYMDRDFNFIRVNNNYAEADGKEPGYFTGKNHFKLYPGKEAEEIFSNVVDTGISHSAVAMPFQYPDQPERGTTYWDWTLSPVKGLDGEVNALLLVLSDVTQTIKAHEQLIIKDRAIATSINAIVFADIRGNITYVNESFLRLWEYGSESELIGTNAETLWDYSEGPEDNIDSLMKTGRWIGEAVCRKKDGKLFLAQLSSSVIKDDNARPVALMGSFVDITRERKAEAQFSVAMRTSMDGFMVVDTAGNIAFANSSALRLIGYAYDELASLRLEAIEAGMSPDEIRLKMQHIIKEGSDRFESSLRTRDGSIVEVELSITCDKTEGDRFFVFIRDISGRKMDEFKRSAILRASLDGFCLVDTKGKLLDVNEAYCKIMGYSRDELLSMGIQDIEAAQGPDEIARNIEKVIRVGSARFETKHRAKNGDILDIEVSSNYLDIEGGRFFAFFRDITRRKRFEAELAASEERYRSIIAESPVGITFCEPSGQCIAANEAIGRIIGATREEVLSQNWRELESWKKTGFYDAAVLALEEQKSRKFSQVITTSFGKQIYLECYFVPFPSGEMLFMAHDFTERYEAEVSLRNSEEKFRSLFENANDAIFMFEADSGIIIQANRKAESLLGIPRDDIPGMRVPDLHPPEEAALHARQFREQMQKSDMSSLNIVPGDIHVQHRDGRRIPVEISPSVTTVEGKKVAIGIFRDISERKKAEETLRQENLFRKAIEDSMLSGIVAMDMDGRITHVNRAYCRMTGWEEDDYIGSLPPYPHWPAEDEEKIKAILQSFINEPDAFPEGVEIRFRKKSGEPFDAILFASDLRGPDEVKSGIVTAVYDITTRKRDEESLRLLRLAIETVDVGVTISDMDGRILFTNPAEEHMHGYEIGELMGREARILAPEASWKRLSENDGSELEHYERESINVRKDGSTFPVLMSSVPLMDDEGKPMAIISVCQDITDRKQAENVLRSTNEFLSLLVDSMPVAVYTCRAKGDFGATYVSSSIREITGYDPGDFTSKASFWVDNIHPEDRERVLSDLGAAFETGQHTHEYRWKCADGSYKWFYDSLKLIRTPEGDIDHMSGSWVDMTEIKNAQEQAMNSRHLASLGELAAGVAHEINNPMSSIINYAQIIKDEAGEAAELKEISTRIIKEGNRVADIVKSLLSFARKGGEEKACSSFYDIVSDTFTLIGAQLRKDGISIDMDIPTELPQIMANPQQITQVLLNLLGNASYAINQKYPHEGNDKGIRISAKLEKTGDTEHLRVSVFDHGTGIPDDLIGRVTDPFFTSKPSGKGTGLGLSICHGIIKDHGGDLEISSREGEYTEVSFTLPVGGGNAG